jgi:deoxyribonuclease V
MSKARTSRYSRTAKLQEEISKQVIEADAFGEIRTVCAVDAAYKGKIAYCSAVVTSTSGSVIEVADSKSEVAYPYVPGFLMLREGPPVLRTLKKLQAGFDLLLVDGHGRLHPRRCGIACYLGVKLDIPTIGVAKSLLCGLVNPDGTVIMDGEVLGQELRFGRSKIYVSVGHRVSLGTAVSLVRDLGKGSVPEAIKLADARSKMQKRERG